SDVCSSDLSQPLIRKLDEKLARFTQLRESMNDPDELSNSQKLIAISKESGQLEPVVGRYLAYCDVRKQVDELNALAANKSDAAMAELAAAELPETQAKANKLFESLKDEFVAAEDNAVDSFFLEIRAGTGGEEAALFARDLYEMYRKYTEAHGYRFDVSDFSTSDRGGFKEVIANVKGSGAFRHLQ